MKKAEERPRALPPRKGVTWVRLITTAKMSDESGDGPPTITSPSLMQQRQAAEALLQVWWNDCSQEGDGCPLMPFKMPESVKTVFMGAVPAFKIKAENGVGYRIDPEQDENKNVFLFYVTQSRAGSTVEVNVLGYAFRSELEAGLSVGNLIREKRAAYEKWRRQFPVAIKDTRTREDGVTQKQGVSDDSEDDDDDSGEIKAILNEKWYYPGDHKSTVEWCGRNALFWFPMRGTTRRLLKGVPVDWTAVGQRGIYFVADSTWNPTRSKNELYEYWRSQKVGGLGSYRPEVLKRPNLLLQLKAYFALAAVAATDPDYCQKWFKAERLYVGYMMECGGFLKCEEKMVELLWKNGLADWLAELADERDVQLFGAVHPGKPLPRFCGLVPLAVVPKKLLSTRVVIDGSVRVYYPDMEALVVHCMRRDLQYICGSVAENEPFRRIESWRRLARIPELMKERSARLLSECRAATKSNYDGDDKRGGNGDDDDPRNRKLDVPPEQLVELMPPCMRAVYENAKNTPRNLKDGERVLFARFLANLGYGPSAYEKLIRPFWEAGRRAARKPVGNSHWKNAWDHTNVWRKGYAKPSCATVLAVKPALGGGRPFLTCVYRNADPIRRVEEIENAGGPLYYQDPTLTCRRHWEQNNPDKVRQSDSQLFYPAQHVFWNLRGRKHLSIKRDDD